MIRNEFSSFQKELYSKDWKALCGEVPTYPQFQAFNKWKIKRLNEGVKDDSISFSDYILFQNVLRSRDWRKTVGNEPAFDEYVNYKKYEGSGAYFRYLDIFRRKPSLEQYMKFEQAKKNYTWSAIQCPIPTFDDYIEFLIERDNVSFEWMKVIGRVPRLEEYMLYADAIKELDKDTRKMKQFSFRAILEQGMDTGEPQQRRRSRSGNRYSRSPSPRHQRSRSPGHDVRQSRRRLPSTGDRRRGRSPSPERQTKRFRSRSPDRNRWGNNMEYTQAGQTILCSDNVQTSGNSSQPNVSSSSTMMLDRISSALWLPPSNDGIATAPAEPLQTDYATPIAFTGPVTPDTNIFWSNLKASLQQFSPQTSLAMPWEGGAQNVQLNCISDSAVVSRDGNTQANELNRPLPASQGHVEKRLSRKQKEPKLCIFPECLYKYANSEKQYCNHLMNVHVVKVVFGDGKKLSKTRMNNIRTYLRSLADSKDLLSPLSGLEGTAATLQNLLKFVRQNKLHKCDEKGCEINADDLMLVQDFHEMSGDRLPMKKINLHKPNCVAALVWYKNIIFIMETLTRQKRLAFQRFWTVPTWNRKREKRAIKKLQHPVLQKYPNALDQKGDSKDVPTTDNNPVNSSEYTEKADEATEKPDKIPEDAARKDNVLRGCDAYFRLDLVIENGDDDFLGEIDDAKEFIYLVAGFEDPKLFPLEDLCEKIKGDDRLYTCVGFEPNLSETATEDCLEKLKEALNSVPKVVAVGAVGLDYSKEGCDKDRQMSVFRKLCEIAKARKLPLVIDCKENPKTKGSLEANRDCVKILQEIFSAEYLIYKKSVASFEEVHIWREAYPNTIYGINGLILREDIFPSFLTFLAIVDLSCIVIESDSPFHHPDNADTNNVPNSVFEIAEEVGNMKGLETSEVLERTSNTLAKFLHLKI